MSLNILIASYLEPKYVQQIQDQFPQVTINYRPDLIGEPQYIAHHTARIDRTPEQEEEWRILLAQADVLFDFDFTHLDDLPDLAPNLKWIQSTSAGIGQLVKRLGYAEKTDWIFTTASGTHARPLAEFALMSMLMFAKNYEYLAVEKANKHWARYCATELADKTVSIIGLGSIGREVAKLAKAFEMRVIGNRRNLSQPIEFVDELFPYGDLTPLLNQADYLVLAVPHTRETEKMITATEFAQLPKGAVIINIARGAVIDEPAMIEALQNSQLAGAALDVFEVEPLPPESPLWEMPNVIISPHSASTAETENAKITNLFRENLQLFLADEPMKNVLDVERLY